MNTFFAHLDKEWREQRRGLVAMLVLVFAVPLASPLLPSQILPDAAPIAYLAALCGAALAALMLASDLVPRESASNSSGVALLARLPSGLLRALHAKALVFALGVVCAAVTAWSAGACADAVRGGLDARVWGFDTAFALLVAGAFLPWLFAASACVTRGAWTAPVAVLATWPAYALTIAFVVLAPNDTQRALALVGNTLAAYFVARAAFVGGHARGCSPRRSAQRGAIAIACVCAPLAGFAAHAKHMSTTVDPARAEFRIEDFLVDATGERVWINAYCTDWTSRLRTRPPRHERLENCRVMVVDVHDGDWQFVGEHGSIVHPAQWGDIPDSTARPSHAYVVVDHVDASHDARLWVTTTVTPVADDTVEDVKESIARGNSGRWWSSNGRATTRPAGSAVADRWCVDPLTGLEVPFAALFDENGKSPVHVVVRDGSWVVWRQSLECALLDPRTCELQPPPPLLAGRFNWHAPLASDGRFVVLSDEQVLLALDPDAPDAAEPFSGLDERFGRIAIDWLQNSWSWSEREARGPVLAHVKGERGEPSYVSLAFDPPRLAAALPSNGAVHRSGVWLDDTRALVLEDDRCLVELDFARGTRRVVFPR